ncbi:MAG: hypothetical protein J6A75_04570 [Lachnospiraceae bacterium]|nr:hypothetical protein [Lachnospiraceae bacterium]
MEKLDKQLKHIFLSILLICSAAVFTGCGTVNVKSNEAVMEVYGEEVVRAEYEMVLTKYVSEVKRQYTTDLVNKKEFWTTEIDGSLPLEQIMELATEECIYKKTVAYLAKEAGIEQETDYAQIIEQSKNKASANGITYGLTSYEPIDYYTYVYTGVESDLTEILKKEKEISEEELRENYENHIEKYTNDVRVHMLIAEMNAELGIDLAAKAAAAIQEETDLELLHEKYPDVNFYELTMSTLNTEEGKSGGYRQRWLMAEGMQEGETCEPFVIGKNIMSMRCLKREENVATDFEEVKGVIKSEIQTKWAKEDIAKKVEAAEVKYEKEVLEKITLEALLGK